MLDIMIDLETLSTETDCVVLSIGAIFFDIEKDKLGAEFYSTLSIQDQLDRGRKISDSTLRWWLSQDLNVFKEALAPNKVSNEDVLFGFDKFLRDNCSAIKKLNVWGNGSSFDISILESLFKCYGRVVPWSYNGVMDLRTFKRFVGNNRKIEVPKDVKHNALADAEYQAQYVLDIINGS